MQADKPRGALQVGDVFESPKVAKGSPCLVISTGYDGGGTGHGPHDVYPDGWLVEYIELSPSPFGDALGSPENTFRIAYERGRKDRGHTFFQSGAFNNVILPKDVKIIGRMKAEVVFSWTEFPV